MKRRFQFLLGIGLFKSHSNPPLSEATVGFKQSDRLPNVFMYFFIFFVFFHLFLRLVVFYSGLIDVVLAVVPVLGYAWMSIQNLNSACRDLFSLFLSLVRPFFKLIWI